MRSRRLSLSKRILSNTLLLAGFCLALTPPAARAQDPLTLFPRNYSLVFENSAVAVIKVHYGPHEKLGVHDHSKTPTVYVYLNNAGHVRYEHAGDKAFSIVRPPVTKGSYRVSSGALERHSIENLDNAPSDFLRVELKQARLGTIPHYRGIAPARLLQSYSRMDVASGDNSFAVYRVICVGSAPCPLEASPVPSLLVTFSALNLSSASGGIEKLEDGAVHWLDAGRSATIVASGEAPAHLIRIFMPVAH